MSITPSERLARILLVSSSPRRREIMQGVRNEVKAFNSDMCEGPRLNGESGEAYVSRLSKGKAEHFAGDVAQGTILAADTTVVLGDETLGKPGSTSEARDMLEKLRGRIHRVVTGVTVGRTAGCETFTAVTSTRVSVREYSPAEMEAYLDTGIPMDRAGAYGVQDTPFDPVTEVDGCYLNVIGLPLCTVLKLMAKVGSVVELHPEVRVPYLARCQGCELRCKRQRR